MDRKALILVILLISLSTMVSAQARTVPTAASSSGGAGLFWVGVVTLLMLCAVGFLVLVLVAWYTVVPADAADVVVQGNSTRIFGAAPKKEIYQTQGSSYFRIPQWFFLFRMGMVVHRIPLKIIAVNVTNFLAFDADRARFLCNIIAYVSVKDPIEAAKRFSGDLDKMSEDIRNVVQATARDATTKKKIREIINDRTGIIKEIEGPLSNAIAEWGLELKDIELVEFSDPREIEGSGDTASHVISDISSIIEEEINSEARQKNAEQRKLARLKEAKAEEEAKNREIERDEEIAKREQAKIMAVAEREKIAREKELDVVRVQQVKRAQIQKEQMIVEANQRKEVEAINKEKKQLEGEGEKLRLQEIAKGNAAKILQDGLATAEAKEKLQEALNKFTPEAIKALIAEIEVDRDRQIGIAVAQALEKADLRILAGGDKGGFDLGCLVESVTTANPAGGFALINKLARPNDLGFKDLEFLQKLLDAEKVKVAERERLSNQPPRANEHPPIDHREQNIIRNLTGDKKR